MIDKEGLKKIFDKAMLDTTCHSYLINDEDGKVKSNVFEVSPCLIIRDFSIGSYPDCDVEFKDFDSAWEYFKSVGKFRLISATGSIYEDNYCNEVEDFDREQSCEKKREDKIKSLYGEKQ